MLLTIREIRASTGLSQAKFCEVLDIPLKTLQHWEAGRRSCPDYVVKLIIYRVQHDESIRNEGIINCQGRGILNENGGDSSHG